MSLYVLRYGHERGKGLYIASIGASEHQREATRWPRRDLAKVMSEYSGARVIRLRRRPSLPAGVAMKTTPEQRADLRADVSGSRGRYMLAEDLRDLLDDLDEALAEVTALRAVAEAARDLFETAAHTEYCDVPILAEQRGKALGRPDSDNWDEAECDCHEGRTRKAIRAALRAWEERELHRLALGVRATK